MPRVCFSLILILGATALMFSRSHVPSPESAPVAKKPALTESSPVCPWREPWRDLPLLFPSATHYTAEKRILSASLVPLQKWLGRPMTADENPLRIHHALDVNEHTLGSVLVCRVKGEHGAIELVAAIDNDDKLHGVLIQSQREPDAVAQVITGSDFLRSFSGLDASSPFRIGTDLPGVAAPAQLSAQAVADGVRSQLIVLSFAESPSNAARLGASFHR